MGQEDGVPFVQGTWDHGPFKGKIVKMFVGGYLNDLSVQWRLQQGRTEITSIPVDTQNVDQVAQYISKETKIPVSMI